MTPERWQKIDRLFQSALERAPAERATFINKACAGDDALRHELEVLLSAEGQAGSFLNAPAYAMAAELLVDGAGVSLVGKRISHYQIIALLGKGGMGEVYRARDERLAREVAIKVLPAGMLHEPDRLKRFEQEARATSALNHPNILTVYDIGTAAPELWGAPYIVAELLEGEELRAHLGAGALPVRKAIEYAQQIAAGLSAAHEKGIVHRDLKPENLFVTKDGRVKILDFGLAKLKPQPLNGGVDSETPTMKPPEKLTASGVVMGTVAYMSPEQVRGEAVDHRSDLFSFGLILFEMLRGERAFKRETMAETMTAILKDDPPKLSETNAKISPQLEKLVRRCLEKKPERRFQSTSDLGFALEALSVPNSSSASRTEAVQALEASATAKRSGWRERMAWMIVASVLVLALLALGAAYFRRPVLEAEPMRFSISPPEQAKVFDWPTISLAGGTPETLCDTPAPAGGAWNREGVILFGGQEADIRRISANGEAVTAVTTVDTARLDNFHSYPTFLPNGRHVLYHIANPDPAKSGIYLASLEGGETRRLLSVDSRKVGVVVNPADQREGYLTFVRQGARDGATISASTVTVW